jgi:hypothetical protein
VIVVHVVRWEIPFNKFFVLRINGDGPRVLRI